MLDYLLAEKNFASLKQYVVFLNDLPTSLQEINRFSDSVARSGYTLLPRPDSQALIQVARDNAVCWRAVGITVPCLGKVSARTLEEVSGFIRQFQVVVSVSANRRSAISAIDPLQFAVVRSTGWGNAPRANIIDVLRELYARLERCQNAVTDFKVQVTQLEASIHSIFIRFIESLTLPLSTEGPMSKIEAYYTLGRIGLPGMDYDPGQPYPQWQRRQMAEAHMARLNDLYRKVSIAVGNLSDFCYRWTYMLDEAKQSLATHHPHQTMMRAKASMPLITGSLNEVKSMSDQLLKMARVF